MLRENLVSEMRVKFPKHRDEDRISRKILQSAEMIIYEETQGDEENWKREL